MDACSKGWNGGVLDITEEVLYTHLFGLERTDLWGDVLEGHARLLCILEVMLVNVLVAPLLISSSPQIYLFAIPLPLLETPRTEAYYQLKNSWVEGTWGRQTRALLEISCGRMKYNQNWEITSLSPSSDRLSLSTLYSRTYLISFLNCDVSLSRDTQVLWLHLDDNKHGVGCVAAEELIDFEVCRANLGSCAVPAYHVLTRCILSLGEKER